MGPRRRSTSFLALAYWRERGLPVVIGRLFNVAGPRQVGAYGMVLPRLIDAALAGRPLEVYGDGRQQRCFAHVADVLRAILALMDAPAAVGRAFNIGSDEPISMLDLAQRVIAAVDPALEIRLISYLEAYGEDFEDCRCRVPDLGRLRATIAYAPQHTLAEIISEIIAWKHGFDSTGGVGKIW